MMTARSQTTFRLIILRHIVNNHRKQKYPAVPTFLLMQNSSWTTKDHPKKKLKIYAILQSLSTRTNYIKLVLKKIPILTSQVASTMYLKSLLPSLNLAKINCYLIRTISSSRLLKMIKSSLTAKLSSCQSIHPPSCAESHWIVRRDILWVYMTPDWYLSFSDSYLPNYIILPSEQVNLSR